MAETESITDDKLAAIRKAAERARFGDSGTWKLVWTAVGMEAAEIRDPSGKRIFNVGYLPQSEHVVESDPDTVIALLDEIDRLRASE